MPMAQVAGEVKLAQVALEACRAAVIACHAASGLCRAAGLQASVKAAHCAEGLMRSAVATASAPVPFGAPGQLSGKVEPQAAGSTKKKQRKRRRKPKARAPQEQAEQKDASMVDAPQTIAAATDAHCEPGGSLVLGDLTEFGIGDGKLALAAPRPAASSMSSSPGGAAVSPAASSSLPEEFVAHWTASLASSSESRLRSSCAQLGLNTQGGKKDLVDRLAAHVRSGQMDSFLT